MLSYQWNGKVMCGWIRDHIEIVACNKELQTQMRKIIGGPNVEVNCWLGCTKNKSKLDSTKNQKVIKQQSNLKFSSLFIINFADDVVDIFAPKFFK